MIYAIFIILFHDDLHKVSKYELKNAKKLVIYDLFYETGDYYIFSG